VSILHQNELHITTELELFSACLRWAECRSRNQEESVREILQPLLGLIRFRTLTCSEFANTVCKSKILGPLEERDILLCLASDDADMPQCFSNKIESRIWLPKIVRQKISLPLKVNNHASEKFSLVSIEVNKEMMLLGIEYKVDNYKYSNFTQSRPSRVHSSSDISVFDPFSCTSTNREINKKACLTVLDVNDIRYSSQIESTITTDFIPPISLSPDRKYLIKLTTGKEQCTELTMRPGGRRIKAFFRNQYQYIVDKTEEDVYTNNGNRLKISSYGTYILAIYIAENV
jgi:hypothetical protein